MEGTEELWDQYWTEMVASKFSIIVAQLLLEEAEKPMTTDDLRDYMRRHAKHIRAGHQHLRRAKRLRKKIERIERKANG